MGTQRINRGDFIRLTAELGAGLGLALSLPACSPSKSSSVPGNQFAPNAWVRIAPDDTVTVVINKSEMGQGVATGLPTILADELDATVLRMAQAPRIDVYIMPSNEKPSGVGEICTPPVAPAVGNAVFVLTGKRIRTLPLVTLSREDRRTSSMLTAG